MFSSTRWKAHSLLGSTPTGLRLLGGLDTIRHSNSCYGTRFLWQSVLPSSGGEKSISQWLSDADLFIVNTVVRVASTLQHSFSPIECGRTQKTCGSSGKSDKDKVCSTTSKTPTHFCTLGSPVLSLSSLFFFPLHFFPPRKGFKFSSWDLEGHRPLWAENKISYGGKQSLYIQ